MRTRTKRNLAVALLGVTLLSHCAAKPPHDSSKPHHTSSGFRNNYPHPPKQSFWKWQWERWRNGQPKAPAGGWHVAQVVAPDLNLLASKAANPSVTWIGHATLLIQVGGLNVLTDPHFTDRASPVGFAGPKRVVPPAIALAQLPHIDAVVISHNHYDHLDIGSVKALAAQKTGSPQFFVPLGLKAWFANLGIERVIELDWWNAQAHQGVTMTCTPVQHWSKRTLSDTNRTLWCGWVIEHPSLRMFFAGDTGYSPDFSDVRRRFQSFDLAALPIGAYGPRWFMKVMHINPHEAVRMHLDLNARQSVAMHWGTFVLSDEPFDEPPRMLMQALDEARVARDEFWVMAIGETRRVGDVGEE